MHEDDATFPLPLWVGNGDVGDGLGSVVLDAFDSATSEVGSPENPRMPGLDDMDPHSTAYPSSAEQ